MRSFCQDRLGTNTGKTPKKMPFLSHLYINAIFLPRQARDNQRGNSKTDRIYKWRASFATMQHSFHLCPPELTMVVSFQIFFVDRQGKREEELFSLSPVRHRPTPAIAAARPARQETPLFFSVSLCLSRACLGKRVSFLEFVTMFVPSLSW